MRWATVTELNSLIPLPTEYAFEQLSRMQIPDLTAKVQQWRPYIGIGAGSCHIREQFYLDKTSLADGAKRDVYVPLIKFAGEIIGMWPYEREPDALSIYERLLIVAPEHRGSRMALSCMSGTERICRTRGAEFA
ncbi:hypothetical protein [Cupriavidus basilensis]|uniref:hypothetical protein n=1 Tax=Cupriavidus basilensis TaxID=68895 RepID=UPI00157AF445|nr:hypothetical protein [Cupriavidus basilensis]NUA27513.1 hypothetical protein [Cupriavidus basilensis]